MFLIKAGKLLMGEGQKYLRGLDTMEDAMLASITHKVIRKPVGFR